MTISEAHITPYHASGVPPATGVLVLAPHPDDEVFGCGGALALHAQAGHRVSTVLVTAGEHGPVDTVSAAYAQTRLEESQRAARELGLGAPTCWHLPDRGVEYGEALVARILAAIRENAADVMYAPSPYELHPDHRAVALAALEATRRNGPGLTLFLYEVSAPLRPNVLVDITPVWSSKQAAMRSFESQEAKLPYASFTEGLNRFRALTLYPAAQHAEAFERLTATDLQSGPQALLDGDRHRLLLQGMASRPEDEPLVSVLIRTTGRPTLGKAVASVALQTYRHLEVVVVDASGRGMADPAAPSAGVALRIVSTGQALGRAQAANAGISAAKGEYLIFLDDDDWLYPDHIAKLVRAVRAQPHYKAAHTGTECVDDQGTALGEVFDFPYAAGELRYGNFLPIHSVLFHRSLIDLGCAFDERFDLYEDWDFWLQVERHTAFAFVPGISAAYRIHAGAGQGVQVDASRARAATALLYGKWQVLQSEDTFKELITRALSRRSMLRRLEQGAHRCEQLQQDLSRQADQAREALREANHARQDAHSLRKAHDEACAARDAAAEQAILAWKAHADALTRCAGAEQQAERLQTELRLTREHAANLEAAVAVTSQGLESARRELATVVASTSWRLTRPLRYAGRRLQTLRTAVRAVQAARTQGLSWTHLFKRTAQVLRQEGMDGLRRRAAARLQPAPGQPPGHAAPPPPARDYTQWVLRHDTLNGAAIASLARQVSALRAKPLVSIVMPVYKPEAEHLLRAIESVQAQVYPHWELCICDDASPGTRTRELLERQAALEPRIRLVFHDRNQHISRATNSAIRLAQGELIAFLDHDDELRPHALLCAVQAFDRQPDAQVLYSDEDKIDESGRRFDPYFKPDFNLGLLRSHNYMCHFAVYRRGLLNELGGLRPGFEGAQDYDLALRAVDSVGKSLVIHVPRVLYHWRTATGSTAAGHGNKAYAFDAGKRALSEHLQRRGVAAEVVEAPEAAGMYRVRFSRPASPPLVSIIIPTRNGQDILRICLDSLQQTSYPNFEVIVVDNGSDDPAALELLTQRQHTGQIRVLRDDRPFNFSALNNRAVREAARGEFILLMNNDIEVTHPEWLDEMVGPAMEAGVGCVGARLWYPDGRLQHGGVVLVCGVAGHSHKYLARGQHGYMGRAVLAQDFAGVTAACLLVRRTIYEEVGGLDESLAVAFNDVDFCLRVFAAGYRNHWTPYAQLVHHESVSRGLEDTPEKQRRFKGEVDALRARWAPLLDNDPHYNPNLTADAEDFSLAWPPRVPLIQAFPS